MPRPLPLPFESRFRFVVLRPFPAALVLAAVLAAVSLFVGVSAVSPSSLVGDPAMREVFFVSRLPRTLSLVMAGAGMAVSGLVMQMLARNRFVEPSTAGTVESASLGLLLATLLVPAAPPIVKMLAAAVTALAGTALFFALLSRIALRSAVIVPLVGIMLGAIVGAATSFLAYRFDLLQSLGAWITGDFSGVLQGRYELVYVAAALGFLAFAAADRFTVAGLGQAYATSLGLGYRSVLTLGLAIVAVVTAAVVATVGAVPFVGLVVPNLVSMAIGDNMRRAVPLVAVCGAIFALACDILGRIVIAPYELPLGAVAGTLGSLIFLAILLRRRHALG